MNVDSVWKECFCKWPADVPRRGVLVTSYDEQILFDGFSTSEHLLLVERRTPDTSGARQVLIAYQNIVAVKIIDVVKVKAFAPLGFAEARPAKASHP
jgi:hypothetical protein